MATAVAAAALTWVGEGWGDLVLHHHNAEGGGRKRGKRRSRRRRGLSFQSGLTQITLFPAARRGGGRRREKRRSFGHLTGLYRF